MEDQCTQEEEYESTQPTDSFSTARESPSRPSIWGALVPLNPTLQTIHLSQPEIVFGRSKECSFHFADMRISQRHCRVSRQIASATTVCDMNPSQAGVIEDSQLSQTVANDDNKFLVCLEDVSTNGTWVNGVRVGAGNKAVLKHGDSIEFVRGNSDVEISFLFRDLTLQSKPQQHVYPSELTATYDVKDKLLGKGAFSEVYLGINRVNLSWVAVKIVDKRRLNVRTQMALKRESEILTHLSHSYIIRIHDIFESERYIYLVLEHAGGGDLFEKIARDGPLPEPSARRIFRQILKGVQYIHSRGVVHRDIKPENILFGRNAAGICVKVTDFGLARLAGSKDQLQSLCGTPSYVAPEIASRANRSEGEPNDSSIGYSKSVDLWSLGVLLYVMLSAQLPFEDASHCELNLFELIERAIYDFIPSQGWESVSNEAKSLISGLLVVDAKERLTVDQALAHPWFRMSNIPAVAKQPQVQKVEVAEEEEEEALLRGQGVISVPGSLISGTPELMDDNDDEDSIGIERQMMSDEENEEEDREDSESSPFSMASFLGQDNGLVHNAFAPAYSTSPYLDLHDRAKSETLPTTTVPHQPASFQSRLASINATPTKTPNTATTTIPNTTTATISNSTTTTAPSLTTATPRPTTAPSTSTTTKAGISSSISASATAIPSRTRSASQLASREPLRIVPQQQQVQEQNTIVLVLDSPKKQATLQHSNTINTNKRRREFSTSSINISGKENSTAATPHTTKTANITNTTNARTIEIDDDIEEEVSEPAFKRSRSAARVHVAGLRRRRPVNNNSNSNSNAATNQNKASYQSTILVKRVF